MYPLFFSLARGMAYLGGLMLSAVILMTCLSILGRELHNTIGIDWINEIKGSYELTEAGMAFVIFAFLPLTQLTAGHAIVDILTNRFGARANRVLRTVGEVLFALVLVLIAVQLGQGMLSKFSSSQVTLFLEFPVWWSYALSLVAAIVAAIVATYVASVRVLEVFKNTDILPTGEGSHQ